jgi:hypothetical protein
LLVLLRAAAARPRGPTSTDDRTHRENRVRSAYIAGIFLLSIPLAYLAPAIAPYFWLVLFIDPSRRLAGRRSGPDHEGDRPPRR